MQLKPNNEKCNYTFSSDAQLDKTGERMAPFPSVTEVMTLIKVEFLTQSAGITGENLWLV